MWTKTKLLAILAENNRKMVDLLWGDETKADKSAPEPSPHEEIARSNKEIARYVVEEVRAGRIRPENAARYERTLQDERDGKTIVMRKPNIQRRLPRSPEECRGQVHYNGSWFFWS